MYYDITYFIGIGVELLKNAMLRQLSEYRKWSQVDVIAGVFTGKKNQAIAESLGMETLYEFVYAGWIINDEGRKTRNGQDQYLQFFDKMQPVNYSAKVMSMRIVD